MHTLVSVFGAVFASRGYPFKNILFYENCRNSFVACHLVTLTFAPWESGMLFCRLLIFFSKLVFSKILHGIPSECQSDGIQIRPDVWLGLIWVQTVCKSYEQTSLGVKVLGLTNLSLSLLSLRSSQQFVDYFCPFRISSCLIRYCKFLNFSEGFIFAKTSQMQSFVK